MKKTTPTTMNIILNNIIALVNFIINKISNVLRNFLKFEDYCGNFEKFVGFVLNFIQFGKILYYIFFQRF